MCAGKPRDREIQRLRMEIRGAVQGVGFRPFVFRLAEELELSGWVLNDSRGVDLEVEGALSELERFLERVRSEAPPRAVILGFEFAFLEAAGYRGFEIRHSDDAGVTTVVMLPDVATCDDCLSEVLDPGDRRYRYPFTNCTNCGPRFTIIRDLPYDRPNTSMDPFRMCEICQGEYNEPRDRRFHAQPNACQECGPRLELWDREANSMAEGHEALLGAADAIRDGKILAAKGLGGFHLMVDARNAEAVDRLRQRKARYEKPLALMVANLEAAGSICRLDAEAERLLASPEAPIVLLQRIPESQICESVAPGNPYLGLMLPYTPLHHLLLAELAIPVVATSANLSDEPICVDNREALRRLGAIADLFLVHDRGIERHVDDSVMTVVDGAPQAVRRARGLAPLPVVLEAEGPTILAVGGHMKNVVALSLGDKVFLSQHIGDMETPKAHEAFERVIGDFLEMYGATPAAVAHDLHPDYPSTRWATQQVGASGPDRISSLGADWKSLLAGLPVVPVQHHHAHLASCLAEHQRPGPALGVTWDGTGFGTDGTIWGGEFLLGDAAEFCRVARLRPFRLPGGEIAVKEPRRTALAVLVETLGADVLERGDLAPVLSFKPGELQLLAKMIESGLRSPQTSSAGRLFDAVASILDLRQRVSFEGQAAMELEFAADTEEEGAYPLPLEQHPAPRPDSSSRVAAERPVGESILELDWRPMIAAIVHDSLTGVPTGIIAARFHNGLVEGILEVSRAVGENVVALTGGCFQNRLLTERTAARLREEGFEVLMHRKVPPNDGGICLGQVAIAMAQLGSA